MNYHPSWNSDNILGAQLQSTWLASGRHNIWTIAWTFLFHGCLGKQSLCYSQWRNKESPCSNVPISLQKWFASFDLCTKKKKKKIAMAMLKEREKESVLPYLWRNQKHLLFTGLHFHGLVHLVQSCQNRVRKGQQINVREAANLHKSPTPSRKTPSWPAGPSNFVTWANGHRNNTEIKKTYFAQIQAFKAASPIPFFH